MQVYFSLTEKSVQKRAVQSCCGEGLVTQSQVLSSYTMWQVPAVLGVSWCPDRAKSPNAGSDPQ